MAYKLNISERSGKTWKMELENEALVGVSIGETLSGKDIDSSLEGYEVVVTGASDKSGFPHKADVEGTGLRRVLLTKGWGMHEKKKGLRKRKTVRGKQISDNTIQINLLVSKEGAKKLAEIFPEQNKPKEVKKAPEQEVKADEQKPDTKLEKSKDNYASVPSSDVKG